MATAPTYTELAARWPHFATSDASEQTRQQTWLDQTVNLIHDDAFRTAALAQDARLLLGAHLVTIDDRTRKHGGGGVGAVTARTNTHGDTVSYEAPAGVAGEKILASTPYGLAYLQMVRGSVELSLFSL